jgi:hypothetical protein
LYPFIYIVLIDTLLIAKRDIFLPVAAMLVLYVNYSLFLLIVRPIPLGMHEKDKAIRVLQASVRENSVYNVSFNMPPGIATGYTYLLDWYGVMRVDKPGIPLIEINNPKKDGDINVNSDIGIKIPQEVRK